MSTSELSITKRRLLGGIAIAAVGIALTACSEAEDKAASAEPKPTVSNETTASTTSAEIPTADRDVDMEAALKPGSLKEMALGDPNAPVKVIEYMSMTCPHCAHFHENTFEAIKTKYVDTGKVYFVLREFPFPQDTASLAAFMLARCTTEDKFFPFVSMLLKQQRTWAAPTDGDVRGAMLQLSKLGGFTQETFDACLTNAQLAGDVSAVRDRGAEEFGVQSTPTFLINGKAYSGDMSVDSMSALIDSLL